MSVFLQPIANIAVTSSGGAGGYSFTNIPQTYTDLFIVLSARSVGSGTSTDIRAYTNNNTQMSDTNLYGNGSGYSSTRESTAAGAFYAGTIPASGATSNTFGNTQIYVSNYTSSNAKSFIIDSVAESNTSIINNGLVLSAATMQMSGNPITFINFYSDGGNFAQYSTAYLYGVLRQGV